MPRVTVSIPARNMARYLAEAVDSVLGQDFPDFELFVCDNASTDGTELLAPKWTDERVRYVRFDTGVGQAANWNRCLAMGTAEYIVLLHADDALHPSFLRSAVAALDENPDAVLLHCEVERIDQLSRPLNVQQRLTGSSKTPSAGAAQRLVLEGCFVNPAGVMFRRSAVQEVGGFSESIVWGVDWHMWLRLAKQGAFLYLDRPLAKYREHPSSGTTAVIASGRNARDELWALDDAFRSGVFGPDPGRKLRQQALRALAHRTWCVAELASRDGHPLAARRGLWEAAKVWPGLVAQPRFWGLLLATVFGHSAFVRLHGLWHRLRSGPRPRSAP